MNGFQKQLVLNSVSMAELSNPARDGVGQPLPPQRVSIVEFESQRAAKPTCPNCGNDRLRHQFNSRWHECKSCRRSFIADCSKWKHGGNLGG